MKDYQTLATKHLTGGILFVQQGDEIQYVAVGYRDLANTISIDEHTRFPTASVGKIFTAVGILRLIEEGNLSLDTTIGSVLPFDLHQIDPEVTIQQLLTHTSGVPDYCDESKFPDYALVWKDYPNYKIRSGMDLVPLFIHEPMAFDKGTQAVYNNTAFTLLGLIIETITNQSFDHYLQTILFDPLKMDRTGYYELDKLPDNTACAYIKEADGRYHSNIFSIDAKGSGAGGAYSTVWDLNKFWHGLFSGKILKPETVQNMLQPYASLEGHQYGLGVWLDEDLKPFVVGVDPGALSQSWYDPNTNTQITIISNFDDNIFPLFQEWKKMQ